MGPLDINQAFFMSTRYCDVRSNVLTTLKCFACVIVYAGDCTRSSQ
jgi:hypothetical protein